MVIVEFFVRVLDAGGAYREYGTGRAAPVDASPVE
jgi:hypothetical protein